MAQRKRSLKDKARLLARRYGIGGTQAVAAVLGFVLLMGGICVLRLRAPANVVVERGEQASSSVAKGADEGGDKDAVLQKSTSAQSGQVVPARVIVHVDGAVVAPGVYELQGADLRINDAVARAGGLRADADTSGMNLAQALADGEKVHVPAVGEEPVAATAAATPDAEASAPAAAGDAGATGGLVNINTATAQELMNLSGVGEATAEAIVQDREQNGPFESVRDLMRVTGIAEKKYAKLEGQICV